MQCATAFGEVLFGIARLLQQVEVRSSFPSKQDHAGKLQSRLLGMTHRCSSVRVVAHGLLLLTLSAEAAMVGPAGIFTSRAWQKRGKYTGRPDMPELDDIALRAGVKSPPWNAPRWVWTAAGENLDVLQMQREKQWS